MTDGQKYDDEQAGELASAWADGIPQSLIEMAVAPSYTIFNEAIERAMMPLSNISADLMRVADMPSLSLGIDWQTLTGMPRMAGIDLQALTGISSKESLLLGLGLSDGWAEGLGQIEWERIIRGRERPLPARRPEPKPLPAPPKIEIVQRSDPDARAVLTDAIKQGILPLAEILSLIELHPEAEGMQEVIEVGIFYETNKGRMTQEACAMHFSMSLATYKRKLQHYRALRKGKHI